MFNFFPIPMDMVEPLPDDQLLEIIDIAKPIEYQETLLKSNYGSYETTLLQSCKISFNLEAAAKSIMVQQKVNPAINKHKRDHDSYGGTTNSASKKGNDSSKSDKKKKVCSHCKKLGHEESECWLKPGQEHLCLTKKCWSELSSSKGKAKPTFTTEQMAYLIQGVHKVAQKKHKAAKKKKQQVWCNSDLTESDQGVHEVSKWLEMQNLDNSNRNTDSSS